MVCDLLLLSFLLHLLTFSFPLLYPFRDRRYDPPILATKREIAVESTLSRSKIALAVIDRLHQPDISPSTSTPFYLAAGPSSVASAGLGLVRKQPRISQVPSDVPSSSHRIVCKGKDWSGRGGLRLPWNHLFSGRCPLGDFLACQSLLAAALRWRLHRWELSWVLTPSLSIFDISEITHGISLFAL